MPNWCANVLTLTHENPVMLDRARKSFLAGSLLNEFLPCPPELLEETPVGEDFVKRDTERQMANKAKYGFDSWYEWKVANWGTKWDVGDTDLTEDDCPIEGNSITFFFDSAWSPPISAMAAFEELYFNVQLSYHEPGMAFCGYFSTEEGDEEFDLENMSAEEVREEIPDWLDDMFSISSFMEDAETLMDNEEE